MGRITWFGEFGEQAIANDAGELESVIDDFLRDSKPRHYDIGPNSYIRVEYNLRIEPRFRRMFSATLEPSPIDGAAVTARIPFGTDKRRAALTDAGWTLERSPSGTYYYNWLFSASAIAPAEIVRVIVAAYRLVYGDRAEQLSWLVHISPTSDKVPQRRRVGLRRP
jgi:hypothetical protein